MILKTEKTENSLGEESLEKELAELRKIIGSEDLLRKNLSPKGKNEPI